MIAQRWTRSAWWTRPAGRRLADGRFARWWAAGAIASLARWLPVALALALLVWSAAGVQAGGVVGNGTAASCTEAALDAALVGGGLVTFNCGPAPVTIVVQQKTIATTTIGAGRLANS